MLEAFRNAAKSWVAKSLLGLLVLSFSAWGITDVFRGFSVQDLATVGNRTVSGSEYSQAINRTMQQYSKNAGRNITLDEVRKLGLDRQVRDNLISAAALDEQASRLGVTISRTTIAQQTANNPAFHDGQGKFDRVAFRRLLESNGLSEESFFASEQASRIRGAVINVAEIGSMPKAFSQAMNQYLNEKRDARYFTFQLTDKDIPKATDEELKKQFEATPQAYTAPEYRSIAILKVEPSDIMSKFEVSQQELENTYDKIKTEYATPEKRTLLQLSFPSVDAAAKAKQRISAGEDFMKIATEMNIKESDITFADRSKEDLLDPKIADAAFALATGGVSDPVQGSLATALVKVTNIVPAKQPTLDELKPELTKKIQLDKATEDIESIYQSVEDMRAEQKKYEDIATSVNIPLKLVPAISSNGLGPDGNKVELPGADEVLKAAFNDNVGAEADAIALNQGYVWYEVRNVTPSAVKPFDSVKAQVQSDWAMSKTRDIAVRKAQDLIKKAKSGATLESLATEAAATIKSVSAIKRNQSSEEFDGAATMALFSIPEKSYTWSLEGDGKSARVIEAGKITLAEADASSPQVKQAEQETKAGLTRDLSDMYLAAVKSTTKIAINEEYWRQISEPSQIP